MKDYLYNDYRIINNIDNNNIYKYKEIIKYDYDNASSVKIGSYGKINSIGILDSSSYLRLLLTVSTGILNNSDNIRLLLTVKSLLNVDPSVSSKSISDIVNDIYYFMNGVSGYNYLSSFSMNEINEMRITFEKFSTSNLYYVKLSDLANAISSTNNRSQTSTDNNSINKLPQNNNQTSMSQQLDTQRKNLEEENIRIEEENKRIVEGFIQDILAVPSSVSFRGWMLPNGQLMSQYTERTEVAKVGSRQDHSRLFSLFLQGLKKYDSEAYSKILALYQEYQKENTYGDIGDSFAVERLGWMQIAVNGGKKVMYRAERWQDRLLRPFLVDLGFNYEVAASGQCHYAEFSDLYDHIEEIIKLAVEEKYAKKLK